MVNFISNELNPVTVLSSEPYARPCCDPALSPATPRVGRRRSSASAWTRSYPEPYPIRSVPFFLERAEHPSNPSCRSPRRCRFRPPLAAVLRFPAPQAARPRPEAPSSLHEPVRANPGPNQPLCLRPPLLLRAEALHRRRAPLPDLPPRKTSRR